MGNRRLRVICFREQMNNSATVARQPPASRTVRVEELACSRTIVVRRGSQDRGELAPSSRPIGVGRRARCFEQPRPRPTEDAPEAQPTARELRPRSWGGGVGRISEFLTSPDEPRDALAMPMWCTGGWVAAAKGTRAGRDIRWWLSWVEGAPVRSERRTLYSLSSRERRSRGISNTSPHCNSTPRGGPAEREWPMPKHRNANRTNQSEHPSPSHEPPARVILKAYRSLSLTAGSSTSLREVVLDRIVWCSGWIRTHDASPRVRLPSISCWRAACSSADPDARSCRSGPPFITAREAIDRPPMHTLRPRGRFGYPAFQESSLRGMVPLASTTL